MLQLKQMALDSLCGCLPLFPGFGMVADSLILFLLVFFSEQGVISIRKCACLPRATVCDGKIKKTKKGCQEVILGFLGFILRHYLWCPNLIKSPSAAFMTMPAAQLLSCSAIVWCFPNEQHAMRCFSAT